MPVTDSARRPDTMHGMYIDWWRALAALASADVTFAPCSDERACMEMLRAGTVDFAGPIQFVDDPQLAFSRPIGRRYTFAGSITGSPFSGAASITGKRIALIETSPQAQALTQQWKPLALALTSSTRARTLLQHGEVDYAIFSFNAGDELALLPGFTKSPLWFHWQHIFARQSGSDTLAQLEPLIDQLGSQARSLQERWLPITEQTVLLQSDARPTVSREALAFLNQHPIVRLGAAPWEPLTVLRDGQFDGLALRMVEYHLLRAGLTPVFLGGEDWIKVVDDARAGLYDGLGYTVHTPLVHTNFLSSEAAIELAPVVISRSDAPFWSDERDLHDQRVIIHPSYGTVDSLQRAASITGESDPDVALAKLRNHAADAWVEYLPVARQAIAAADANDVKLAFRLGGPKDGAIALRRDWAPVMPLINQSIASMSHAARDQIYENWNRQTESSSVRFIAPSSLLGIIAILLAGLVLLLRLLRREHRTARQRELALRQAQLIAGIGSFELAPPYDKMLLDGETPRLLGIRPDTEMQSLDAHLALFESPDTLREKLVQVCEGGPSVRMDAVRKVQPPQIFSYEFAAPRTVRGCDGVIIATLQNVTEERARAEHEKTLEREVLQLQKLDAIGRLAGGIAHDFNNVLAASIGYNELALRDLPSGHPAQQPMEQVLNASLRSRDLVRQILAFSRRHVEEHQALQWGANIRETVEFLRASTPATVQINVHTPPAPVWVKADHGQLAQVLINLVTNAIDAVSNDGVIDITLEHLREAKANNGDTLKESAWARLRVTDNGPGIDPAIRGRVFDPFFTTKPVGKGTGLGLSIVHGVVRAHDGRVSVVAPDKGGTEFAICLAMVDQPNVSCSVPQNTRHGKSQTVLLVDDESALIDVNRRLLTGSGYEVTAFTSAADALEVFRRAPEAFDIVITDLTMPDMSGSELAEQIDSIRAGMPIILTTGYGINSLNSPSRLFCSILQKPFSSKDLISSITTGLESRAGNAPQGSAEAVGSMSAS